ncbi:MAG: hypothetical protein RL266_2023 [Bacteroidota bacterium]|jgi:hypothetical protein
MKSLSSTLLLCFTVSLLFAQEDFPVKIDNWVPHPKNPEMGRVLDWKVYLPTSFKDRLEKKRDDGRLIVVTGSDHNGPFKVNILRNDSLLFAQGYTKGELVRDTIYIESPDPPYDLRMTTDEYYEAIPVD